jgi:hypothetical protein
MAGDKAQMTTTKRKSETMVTLQTTLGKSSAFLKFAAPDAVERDSKHIFRNEFYARTSRSFDGHMRRKATSVARIVEIQPRFRLLINSAIGVMLFLSPTLRAEAADEVKVTDLMTKSLVNVPGKEVTMITVDYPPGGADPVHRHTPAPLHMS